jgi:L-fucose mutarotase
MLKGIPPIILLELLKVLMEMGHGDEIVLANGNYPAESTGIKIIKADDLSIPELMKAILQFFLLDTYEEHQKFINFFPKNMKKIPKKRLTAEREAIYLN